MARVNSHDDEEPATPKSDENWPPSKEQQRDNARSFLLSVTKLSYGIANDLVAHPRPLREDITTYRGYVKHMQGIKRSAEVPDCCLDEYRMADPNEYEHFPGDREAFLAYESKLLRTIEEKLSVEPTD